MSGTELVSTIALVIALLGLGLFFGSRQVQTWRRLKSDPGMAPMERAYLYKQAQRRFICSVLMIVFAAFLVGSIFIYQDLQAVQVADAEEKVEHPLVRTFTYYWMGGLFVLFALLSLAVFDLVATARHGFRSARQLDQQRRAEIEADLARLRREWAERN